MENMISTYANKHSRKDIFHVVQLCQGRTKLVCTYAAARSVRYNISCTHIYTFIIPVICKWFLLDFLHRVCSKASDIIQKRTTISAHPSREAPQLCHHRKNS